MDSSVFQSVSSLITSGETFITIYLYGKASIVSLFDITKLTDTVSLVCGDGTGTVYCGARQLIIWDNTLNTEHILSTSSLFTLNGTQLTIETSDVSLVGVHRFTFYVSL